MTSAESKDRFKLLVVGVGGQGVLTAARFLGDAALAAGLPVIVGQLHGMSQRGGSVECSVIIGPGQSSFIGAGEADVVLGLEPLEVVRALPMIASHTRVVVNLGNIVPFSLAMKGEPYPPMDGILSQIRERTHEMFQVDGPDLVGRVGVPRTLNVVMLGAAAALDMLPFDDSVLWKTVEAKSPARFLEANRTAFQLGQEAVSSQRAGGA